jgi:hypothetical protein
MVNPFRDINWKPGLGERRKFGRSLVIGFPCVGVVFLVIGWIAQGQWDANLDVALWVGGVGAGAGLLFVALPRIALPFYLGWYFAACCVGMVISNLLLAGFFYLAVTPFGLIRRLGGKSLSRGFDRSTTTYWKDPGPGHEPGRYYKQF